ncbi:tyrosine-type recombinase/integrase [Sphaerisporangium viridialbum]|uniref:tyrosine-type recombinase/integrase n=1 Tax=Sphaerisporangium viridialbum TaxID=46189 RepID=UPI003C70669F
MTAASRRPAELGSAGSWVWPVDVTCYDRRTTLSHLELAVMQRLDTRLRHRTSRIDDLAEWNMLGRLTRPLDDAAAALHHADTELHRRAVADAIGLVLLRCAEEKTSFWAWSAQGWLRLIGVSIAEFQRPWPDTIDPTARPHLVALAYLLGGFTDFDRMGPFGRLNLARRIFGIELVDHAYQQVSETLGGWGYRIGDSERERMTTVLSQLLLLNGSPLLADLTTEAFIQLRPRMRRRWQVAEIHGIQRAAASLGFCDPPSSIHAGLPAIEGTAESWATWVDRWHSTSTLTPKVRAIFRSVIAKAGRWLAAEHPEITEPSEWTRQTCAAWVATIDRLTVGEHVQRHAGLDKRKGDPISPRTKAGYLTATRTFFRDCQEWEWFPRRFDPARALATPRTIQALIGPNPRVIADDIWAKLLWAGLNIEADDLPANASGPCYPMELIRAITLTWLFSGQRSDEIARLRIGCIRWQHDGTSIPGDSRDVLAEDAVCLLDIPTHKTGTAFTKPVDPLLGQAIEAWQAVRPDQPKMLDRKTGEPVDLLFATRARRVAKAYINDTIIPTLCRKAGVPTADLRGNITSHRARATIATQLYNAKEPMTLFELQEWLGHRSPETTQHYAKITPNKLAQAYKDAGYFARNVRTIEVLVDRDAVTSGAVAAGEPWQYYDMGHGYCTYTFFEQCPHRMACARCDFYTPKASSKALLLEAKDNLQRMLANIPLTDDERAAVDDGQAALDRLLGQLADVPTPAGPTPREISTPAQATLLPVIEINRRPT